VRPWRQQRIDFLVVLAGLGFSCKEMSQYSGINELVILSDMRLIGGIKANCSNRPKGQQKKIGLIKEFAKLFLVKERTVLEESLFQVLTKALEVNVLFPYLRGVVKTMERLYFPECTVEQRPYLDLLKFVYGSPQPSDSTEDIWRMFWVNLSHGIIYTEGDLHQDLYAHVLNGERRRITPVWPAIAVEEIEATLDLLESRRAFVVRAYFGLGVEKQKIEVLAKKFRLSSQSIRRDLIVAKRKLWYAFRNCKLDLLVLPMNKHVDDVIAAHRIRRLMVGSEDIPIELLLKPVQEIEMSVRSAHCLYNANIVYVGELIAKTETEFLKIKRLGRKSFKEIKELLLAMDLQVGTFVSKEHLQHMSDLKRGFI
jgi:hypothetical protein